MIHRLFSLWVAIAFVAAAQVVVYPDTWSVQVVDGASLTPGITPGGMFIVRGYRSAYFALKVSPLPLQEIFSDVSVTLKPVGGGNAVSAFIVYVDGKETQVAAVLPSSVPPGDYDLTVTSVSSTVKGVGKTSVKARKYRTLANNGKGYGLAVARNYVDATHLDRNMFVTGSIDGSSKAPAKPGQTVIALGVGFGASSAPDNDAPGEIDLRSTMEIRVAVGGIVAEVSYAGRAPDSPGRDQIQFTIPADAPTGCNVPLEVIVDGSPGNPVTIAIAPPDKDACEHPYLTREKLEMVDQGKQVLAGEFNMTVYTEVAPFVSGQPWVEIHSALGYFGELTASRVSTVNSDSIPLGRCVSWRTDGRTPGALLDAGTDDSADGGAVTLTGPSFTGVPLDDDDDWYYRIFSVRRLSDGKLLAGNAQHILSPGEYVLRGLGGAHVDSFEAKIQAPDFLTWTNLETVESIDHQAPPEIVWTGGGARDRIIVEGISALVVGGSSYFPELDAVSFACAIPSESRSFTPPADVLKLLPKSNGSQTIGYLMVAAFAQESRAAFQSALKQRATDLGFGTELGMGTFGHLMMISKTVTYR